MASKSSVNKWWLSYEKEGKIKAKPRLGSKRKIDPQQLKIYVETNADQTLVVLTVFVTLNDLKLG